VGKKIREEGKESGPARADRTKRKEIFSNIYTGIIVEEG